MLKLIQTEKSSQARPEFILHLYYIQVQTKLKGTIFEKYRGTIHPSIPSSCDLHTIYRCVIHCSGAISTAHKLASLTESDMAERARSYIPPIRAPRRRVAARETAPLLAWGGRKEASSGATLAGGAGRSELAKAIARGNPGAWIRRRGEERRGGEGWFWNDVERRGEESGRLSLSLVGGRGDGDFGGEMDG